LLIRQKYPYKIERKKEKKKKNKKKKKKKKSISFRPFGVGSLLHSAISGGSLATP
jgi:hypothetical protein